MYIIFLLFVIFQSVIWICFVISIEKLEQKVFQLESKIKYYDLVINDFKSFQSDLKDLINNNKSEMTIN